MVNQRIKILIISFSDIESDPRVNRQLCFFKDEYELYTIGFGKTPKDVLNHVPITQKPRAKFSKLKTALLLLLGLFEKFYWDGQGLWNMKGLTDMGESWPRNFDLVLANEIDALPLALRLANGKPVLFDAHEFAPREFEDIFMWRLFFMSFRKYLCRRYIHRAAAMTTVCDGIAAEYRRIYSVDPQVITNATEYADCTPSNASDGRISMVHHGVALPSRKLEMMFTMMEHLDERFSLDLMLVPTVPLYFARLQEMARGDGRISFVPPVPVKDIPYAINKYDIGLFFLEPVNFNYKHALPNKLFEFVQARLAIAIGPSPEMASIVNKYDLGLVTKSFDPKEMARSLNELTKEKIQYYKNQSHRFARELSADENKKKLLKIVAGMI
jgi:hypothetical protein